jgi:hypothetical protein
MRTKLSALIASPEMETNFHEKRNHGLHLLVTFTTNDAFAGYRLGQVPMRHHSRRRPARALFVTKPCWNEPPIATRAQKG